jgi:uncharacterized damage-inducible protein DinB
MLELFRRLFVYDQWSIARSLSTLDPSVGSQAKLLLSHILLAEAIWLKRLNGEDSSDIPTSRELSFEECERQLAGLSRDYIKFVDSLSEDSLTRPITYKNTKGIEFTTPVSDILMHVAMHGAYHRGQIALLVRNSGGTAANTDYITFTRL